VRYAYAITAALLAGGAAATLTMQQPVGAQIAQNAGSQATSPRGGPASFADLAARLQPAVVNISTTQRVKVPQQQNPFAGTPFDDLFRQFGGGGGGGDDDGDGNSGGGQGGQGGSGGGKGQTREAMSLGSGFIISTDGFIVTNNHVISGGDEAAAKNATLESITVTMPDRTEYKARIVGRDSAADLAVLKIDAPKPLPFVQFGDSTHTRVGDWVIAIGNPFALGGSVTAGIVSAIHRAIGANGAYDRYIQTDAAINSGNSGGPMFDMAGNVVGINTAIYSPSGGNVGIGFAIPAEEAKPVVDVLMKGGRVKRGYLGIQIQPITDDIASALGLPKNHGEIVARVEPGYPAAKAGLQQGDVVVKVNNVEVTPDNTLSYIVSNLPIGSRIPIEVIRHNQHLTLTAVIAERPPEAQLSNQLNGGGGDEDDNSPAAQAQSKATTSALGLGLQAINPRIAQQLGIPATVKGLVIASVDSSSDAASNGLKRGDVILSINQTPVTTVAAAAGVIAQAQKEGRDTVLLLVQRGTQPGLYIGVKLNKK
jgi:serine protease Do